MTMYLMTDGATMLHRKHAINVYQINKVKNKNKAGCNKYLYSINNCRINGKFKGSSKGEKCPSLGMHQEIQT